MMREENGNTTDFKDFKTQFSGAKNFMHRDGQRGKRQTTSMISPERQFYTKEKIHMKKKIEKLAMTWIDGGEERTCLLDDILRNVGGQLAALTEETQNAVEYYGDSYITRCYLMKVVEIKERINTLHEVFRGLNEGDIISGLL